MTTTLRHSWWRTHREGQWVCTLLRTWQEPVRISHWAPCWVLPNSLNIWVLGLATPCYSLMSQMQGTCPKEPTSYPITDKRDRIFYPEEATHQGCSRLGRGQGQHRSVCDGCYKQVQENPFTVGEGPPQCRMSQIPPASTGLYCIWIIILKCTLMLKKSLLQNFKATIKYSIVMAQLNGLAWENWGL